MASPQLELARKVEEIDADGNGADQEHLFEVCSSAQKKDGGGDREQRLGMLWNWTSSMHSVAAPMHSGSCRLSQGGSSEAVQKGRLTYISECVVSHCPRNGLAVDLQHSMTVPYTSSN